MGILIAKTTVVSKGCDHSHVVPRMFRGVKLRASFALFSVLAVSLVALFFGTHRVAAADTFELAASTNHKLHVFADGGAGWCVAHLSLRMELAADSPDFGNPATQLDVMNRLKQPIAAACAAATVADLTVVAQGKPQGLYHATAAGGWVFAAAAPSAPVPATLDAEPAAVPAPPAATAKPSALPHVAASQPGDVPNSHDPAGFRRYEGSQIIHYGTRNINQYQLMLPKYGGEFIEGNLTRVIYREPEGHSSLEIFRNYEGMLTDAGYQILYKSPTAMSRPNGEPYYDGKLTVWFDSSFYGLVDGAWFGDHSERNGYYLTAKATKDGQDVTAIVFVMEMGKDYNWTNPSDKKPQVIKAGQVIAYVDLVSAKAIERKMVTVTSSDMAAALATKGSIDIYGILFDIDKADIKPDSTKTLDEVANLLKIDRSLKLEISGHTDSTGDKDHNMMLSENRAKAVVDALVSKYGIDPARMQAKGYGDTKPVAANDTEDGRAKNRRVELRKI